MPVHSRPLKDGIIRGGSALYTEGPRESPRAASLSQPRIESGRIESGKVVGVFALLIGMPIWVEAARYTRDGWIAAINWLCARLAIPWSVPPLHWAIAMGLIVALGVGYSHIELDKQPLQRRGGRWVANRHWEVWVVWAVLVATDVGTTYIGARQPDPSGLSVVRDIAANVYTLLIYAILITFFPDRLIRFGWRLLRK